MIFFRTNKIHHLSCLLQSANGHDTRTQPMWAWSDDKKKQQQRPLMKNYRKISKLINLFHNSTAALSANDGIIRCAEPRVCVWMCAGMRSLEKSDISMQLLRLRVIVCVCAALSLVCCASELAYCSSLGVGKWERERERSHMHATALTRLDYKLDRKMVCLTPCIRLIFKTCVSSIILFYARLAYMHCMCLTQSSLFWDCWCRFSHAFGVSAHTFPDMAINALDFSYMTKNNENKTKKHSLLIITTAIIIIITTATNDVQKSLYLIIN